MKFLRHCLILTLSFIIIGVWQYTLLSEYTIQLLGLLIVVYLVLSFRKKGRKSELFIGTSRDIFILNTAIFLLVFSTGGLHSSLFFLLYFLGFGIAFVFEPASIAVFVLGAVAIFLPEVMKNDILGNVIRIGSITFIAPLAFFFGQEFKKGEVQEGKIEAMEERAQDSADTIAQKVEDVLKTEKENLTSTDVEKLDEVLEETETLRQETKE